MSFYEAIPHMSTFDDEYKGYHIPKGSIVMGNSWLVVRPLANLIFCPELLI